MLVGGNVGMLAKINCFTFRVASDASTPHHLSVVEMAELFTGRYFHFSDSKLPVFCNICCVDEYIPSEGG